jgi:D-glutamate cyclase
MSTSDRILEAIGNVIQEDVNDRGLRSDPRDNLITACPQDFANAAKSLATDSHRTVGILTGFFISHAQPPCGETDGPLGAIFLARALIPLGFRIVIYTDGFCLPAIQAGVRAACLSDGVCVVEVAASLTFAKAKEQVLADGLTHLIALERVGPGHTLESIRAQSGVVDGTVEEFVHEVPEGERGRLRNMRGADITASMAPGHLLVEAANSLAPAMVTIGIGDGGNEIGMGKIPWPVIRRNINRGGLIACRTPTTHLIVCGISNWGAYGLGVAVRMLRGRTDLAELLNCATERTILQAMVEQGPLVDGVLGKQSLSVDGLNFERYIAPFQRFQALGSTHLAT